MRGQGNNQQIRSFRRSETNLKKACDFNDIALVGTILDKKMANRHCAIIVYSVRNNADDGKEHRDIGGDPVETMVLSII